MIYILQHHAVHPKPKISERQYINTFPENVVIFSVGSSFGSPRP